MVGSLRGLGRGGVAGDAGRNELGEDEPAVFTKEADEMERLEPVLRRAGWSNKDDDVAKSISR